MLKIAYNDGVAAAFAKFAIAGDAMSNASSLQGDASLARYHLDKAARQPMPMSRHDPLFGSVPGPAVAVPHPEGGLLGHLQGSTGLNLGQASDSIQHSLMGGGEALRQGAGRAGKALQGGGAKLLGMAKGNPLAAAAILGGGALGAHHLMKEDDSLSGRLQRLIG